MYYEFHFFSRLVGFLISLVDGVKTCCRLGESVLGLTEPPPPPNTNGDD